MQMEKILSQMYDKYTKLKSDKGTEIDKINQDQELKFVEYISAADELIEHLRNENDRLRSQIIDLSSEMASIRTSKNDQHVKYQRPIMDENQKNKNLSDEAERLQELQNEGLHYSAGKDKTDNRHSSMSGSAQVESDTIDILNTSSRKKHSKKSVQVHPDTINVLNSNTRRKRSRRNGKADEVTITPCASGCAPESESASDLFTQTELGRTGLNIDQPACCRRKIDLSGSGIHAASAANCLFQDLFECLVGMKVATVTQADGICISALHQSSGYSFSLTWLNKAGREDVEVLYRVLSLGTFERVAPDWMKEVIIFSMTMSPIFFERISRVMKLQQ